MREYQVGGGTARALVVEKGVVVLKRGGSGLRPATFSAVRAGLVGLGHGSQDWRPGLLSAVPAGLVPIRVES